MKKAILFFLFLLIFTTNPIFTKNVHALSVSVNGNFEWTNADYVDVTASVPGGNSQNNGADAWMCYVNGVNVGNKNTVRITNEGITSIKFIAGYHQWGSIESGTYAVKIDRTPPEISVKTYTRYEPFEAIIFVANASDSFSNIDESSWECKYMKYSWRKGKEFLVPVWVPSSSDFTYQFRVRDKAGNEYIYSNTSLSDQTKPKITITNTNAAWENTESVTVTADATDIGSGVNVESWQYQIGIGTWQNGSSAIVTEEGATSVTFKVKDIAGNEGVASTIVRLDRSPPSINLNNPCTSWANMESATVTADAFDTGSGINAGSCQYKIGDNPWENGTGAVVTAEGETTVEFKVQDNVGKEAFASTVVKLDKTAPSINISNPNTGWQKIDSVNVTASATDAVSGLNDASCIQYRLNDGEWINGNSVDISDNGNTKVIFKAVDRAGNEALGETSVMIDKQGPELSIKNPMEEWQSKESVLVEAVAIDKESGVDENSFEYSVNDSDFQPGSSATVTQEGRTTLIFRCKDKLGNESAINTYVLLDRTKPEISHLSLFPVNLFEYLPSDNAFFTLSYSDLCGSETGKVNGFWYIVSGSAVPDFANAIWYDLRYKPPSPLNPIIQASGLKNGRNYLHVKASDQAGNESDTASIIIKVDTSLPGTPYISSTTHPYAASPSDAIADKNPVFTIMPGVSGLSGIREYEYVLEKGGVPLSDKQHTKNGSRIYITGLPDNAPDEYYTLKVWAVGGSGNKSDAQAEYRFRIDSTPPAMLTVKSSTHLNEGVWYPSWTASFEWNQPIDFTGIKTYYYKISDTPLTTDDTEGRISTLERRQSVNLKNVVSGRSAYGTMYFGVWAEDFAGNVQFDTRTVRFDTILPSLEILPGNGAVIDIIPNEQENSAVISWGTPCDNIGIATTSVKVIRYGENPNATHYVIKEAGIQNQEFTALQPDIDYVAYVKTTDLAGNEKTYAKAFRLNGSSSIVIDIPFAQWVSGCMVHGIISPDSSKNQAFLVVPDNLSFKTGSDTVLEIALTGLEFSGESFVRGEYLGSYSLCVAGFLLTGRGIEISAENGLVLNEVDYNIITASGISKTITLSNVKLSEPPKIAFSQAVFVSDNGFDYTSKQTETSVQNDGYRFTDIKRTGFDADTWMIFEGKIDLSDFSGFVSNLDGIKEPFVSAANIGIASDGVIVKGDILEPFFVETGGNTYKISKASLTPEGLLICKASLLFGSGRELNLENFKILWDGTVAEQLDFRFSVENFTDIGFAASIKSLFFIGDKLVIKDGFIGLGDELGIKLNDILLEGEILSNSLPQSKALISFGKTFPGFLMGGELEGSSLSISLDTGLISAEASVTGEAKLILGKQKLKDSTITLRKASSAENAVICLGGKLVLDEAFPCSLSNLEIPVNTYVLDAGGKALEISASAPIPDGSSAWGSITFKDAVIEIVHSGEIQANPLFCIKGNLLIPSEFAGGLENTLVGIKSFDIDPALGIIDFRASRGFSGEIGFMGEVGLLNPLITLAIPETQSAPVIDISGEFILNGSFPGYLQNKSIYIEKLSLDSDGNIIELSAPYDAPYLVDLVDGIRIRQSKTEFIKNNDGEPEIAISGSLVLQDKLPGVLSGITVDFEKLIIGFNGQISEVNAYASVKGEHPFIGKSILRDPGISIYSSGSSDSLRIGVSGSLIFPSNEEGRPEISLNLVSLIFDGNGSIVEFDAALIVSGTTSFIGESLLKDAQLAVRKAEMSPLEIRITGIVIIPNIGSNQQDIFIDIEDIYFTETGEILNIDVSAGLQGDTPIAGGIVLRNGGIGFAKEGSNSLEMDVHGTLVLPEMELECFSKAEIAVDSLKFDMNGNLKALNTSLSLPGERTLVGGLKIKDGILSINKPSPSEPLLISVSGTLIMPSDAPGVLGRSQFAIESLIIDENGNILTFSASLILNGENEFIGNTKLKNAVISVNKQNTNTPVEFIISGAMVLPSDTPGILANAEIAIGEFRLDTAGGIRRLNAGLSFPGERQLLDGITSIDLGVSIDITDNAPFLLSLGGKLVLGDSFPEGLKGLALSIQTFTIDGNGQIIALDIGLNNINLTLFNSIKVSETMLQVTKGTDNNEFIFSIAGNITLPDNLPNGLGGMRIAIKRFIISSRTGIREFQVGTDSRIEFELTAGINAGFNYILVSDKGISLSGDIKFPENFPEGLANNVISLNKFDMNWQGSITDIEAGISTINIKLAGFTVEISDLAFTSKEVTITSCMLVMPVGLDMQKIGFKNARIDSSGKFYGDLSVSEIKQDIAGFMLCIKDPVLDFDNNRMSFSRVALKMPAALGGSEFGINGVVLNPSGIQFTGGEFALPNFEIAGGLGFRDIRIGFVLDGNNFKAEGGGSMMIPGLGTFEAEVAFVNISPTYPIGLKRAQFTYTVSGMGIPLGTTGLFINQFTGGIAFGPPDEMPVLIRGMFDDGIRINMGVGIADRTGGNLLKGRAQIWLDITDCEFAFRGDVAILRGLVKGEVIAAITKKGFYGYVGVELTFVRGHVELMIFEYNKRIIVNGAGEVQFGIPRGAIVNTRFQVFWWVVEIVIPWDNMWLPGIGAEFGLFKNGAEGFKGYVDGGFLFGKIGVFINSNGGIDLTNISKYELYRPFEMSRMAEGRVLASSQSGLPGGIDQSTDEKLILPEKISGGTVSDTFRFFVPGSDNKKARSSTIETEAEIKLEAPSENTNNPQQEVERIIFAVACPEGIPELTAVSPSGIRYTSGSPQVVMQYTEWGVLYAVLNPEPGEWSLIVENIISKDSYHVEVIGKTRVPELVVETPASVGEVSGSVYKVNGKVEGAPVGSEISVYITESKDGCVGMPLATAITDSEGRFTADVGVTGIADGEYFVMAALKMPDDAPDVRAYASGSIIVRNSTSLKAVQDLITSYYTSTDKSGNEKYGIEIAFRDINGDRAQGFYLYVDNVTKGTKEKILLGYLTDTKIAGFDAGDVLEISVVPYDSQKREGEQSEIKTVTIKAPLEIKNEFSLSQDVINLSLKNGQVFNGEILLINGNPEVSGSAYDYADASVVESPDGLMLSVTGDAAYIAKPESSIAYTLYADDTLATGNYRIVACVENRGNRGLRRELIFNVTVIRPEIEVGYVTPLRWNNRDEVLLTINGSNLHDGTRVLLDGTELELTEITLNLIKAKVPKDIAGGEHFITVVGPQGDKVDVKVIIDEPDFEIIGYKTAAIALAGGTEKFYFSLKGLNGFNEDVSFSVKNVPGNWEAALDKNILSDGDTAALTVSIPSGESLGIYQLKLISSKGNEINIEIEVADTLPAPVISSLSNYSAFAGDVITVYGYAFGSEVAVTVGDVPMNILDFNQGAVKVQIPQDAQSGEIKVIRDGLVSQGKRFIIKKKKFGIYSDREQAVLCASESAEIQLSILGYEKTVSLKAESDNSEILAELDRNQIIPNGIAVLKLSASADAAEGDYRISITGSGESGTVTKVIALKVEGSFCIDTDKLPDGIENTSYSTNLETENERGVVSFSIIEGCLPMGLIMDNMGNIKGMPLETGEYYFTVKAADSHGRTASKRVSVLIKGSSWYTEDGNGGRTRFNPVKAPADSRVLWAVDGFNGSSKLLSTGNRVYVLAENALYGLFRKTGEVAFRIDGSYTDAALVNNSLCLLDSDKKLCMVDAALGKIQWTKEGVDNFTTDGKALTIIKGKKAEKIDVKTGETLTVLAPLSDNCFYLWQNGRLLAVAENKLYGETGEAFAVLYEADKNIHDAASDSEGSALLLSNGKLVLLNNENAKVKEVATHIKEGKIILANDRVFVSGEKSMAAYNRNTLRKIFIHEGFDGKVAAASEKVFIINENKIIAINGFNGKVLWTQPCMGADVILAGEFVYTLSTSGEITCYNGPDNPTYPTTGITINPKSPEGANSFYDSCKPYVTLSASDTESYVKDIWYSINGSPWKRYEGKFNLGEGINTLKYYSQDSSGYSEPVRTRVVKVDTEKPAVGVELNGIEVKKGCYIQGVRFVITATDNASGIELIQYRVNGSSWKKYTGDIVFSDQGKYKIEYRAKDMAGHYSDKKFINMTVNEMEYEHGVKRLGSNKARILFDSENFIPGAVFVKIKVGNDAVISCAMHKVKDDVEDEDNDDDEDEDDEDGDGDGDGVIWEYELDGIKPGSILEYSFTIQKEGKELETEVHRLKLVK